MPRQHSTSTVQDAAKNRKIGRKTRTRRKKRPIQYVARCDLRYRFYIQCFIHIYAVYLIDEHIYLFAYRHHDVYGDDKPLDSPIF